ncbi:MAG: hypothetical protein IJP12_00535 [Methanobrevibacter sp.]|nr:hypothetical protein [Methanobrevibacter sp.]
MTEYSNALRQLAHDLYKEEYEAMEEEIKNLENYKEYEEWEEKIRNFKSALFKFYKAGKIDLEVVNTMMEILD